MIGGQALAARYFDGRQSTAHPVWLSADAGQLHVHGEGVSFSCPWATVDIGETLGEAPRRLDLGDYGHCEVAASARLDDWLREHGQGSGGLLCWAQERWLGAVAAVGACVLAVVCCYLWGLPALAGWLAPRLPESVAREMSAQTLQLLDQHLLQASQLPPTRQQTIAARFHALLQAGDPPPRLLFRRAGTVANAFALPDGTIVLFDGLVGQVENEQEIDAVLLHELGHVTYRHGLRQFIQSSLVGVAAGLYFGDLSALAGSFAAMIGSAGYSRDFEREADRFAAQRLRAKGLSPELLATALGKLQQAATTPGGRQEPPLPAFLHSHPDPQARIAALRQAP